MMSAYIQVLFIQSPLKIDNIYLLIPLSKNERNTFLRRTTVTEILHKCQSTLWVLQKNNLNGYETPGYSSAMLLSDLDIFILNYEANVEEVL